MEHEELLKQELKGSYQGYELQALCKTGWDENDMVKHWYRTARRLQRIPAKIGYFIDKSKIAKAWKTEGEADPRDNWYFILTIDGTMFEAHY